MNYNIINIAINLNEMNEQIEIEIEIDGHGI